jgi:hypothetical protein
MIISKLQGGLGNQLFQWAIVKNLSLEYNIQFFLDIRSLSLGSQFGITKRNFSLNKFPNLDYKIIDDINFSNFKIFIDNFKYQSFQIDVNENLYFNGYWQTQKYFEKNKNEILQSLSPDINIQSKLNTIIPKKNNSISLHVRRTDYLTSNGFHLVQPIQYYQSAIEEIGTYDQIYVFSDDIHWCKNNLHFDNIIFMENRDELEDLWLMSYCKNNIIANSSFSWWGAWLNTYKDKKVITPKKWYGDWVNIDMNEIIPENWIKI